MGKTLRFFKSLLGFKTNDSPPSEPNKQLKRRWSFGKSLRGLHNHTKSIDGNSLDHPHYNLDKNEDPNKRAIALAAATAAVVDAAVAAAQAAAEVVRMTGGTIGYGDRNELAAIKIQAHFRGYLARRALRALKALVRLQAVVRGHILRKQTAGMMRRLQALIRAQERACAVRSQINGSTTKHSHFHHHGPPTSEKNEHFPHTKHDHRSISKRNGSKSYVQGIIGQERMFLDGLKDRKNEKIIEVDTSKSHITTKERKLFQPDYISFQHSHSLTTSRGSTLQPTSSSPCASCEVNSFYYSMRRGVSTSNKSECSRSCISSFSDHPNYMAYTESSRAKVRSLSAPRLRPDQLEVFNATRRDSGYKHVTGMQRGPTTHDSFAKKTYPASARLDWLRLPVYDTVESEYCDGYWN